MYVNLRLSVGHLEDEMLTVIQINTSRLTDTLFDEGTSLGNLLGAVIPKL